MDNLKEKNIESIKKNLMNNLDFSRKKINSLRNYFISIKKDWIDYIVSNQISVNDGELIVYLIFFSNIERSIKKIKFKNGKKLNKIEREFFKEMIFKAVSRSEIGNRYSFLHKINNFFNIKNRKKRFDKIKKLNNWYNIIFKEVKKFEIEDHIKDFLKKIIKFDFNKKKVLITKTNKDQYRKNKFLEKIKLFFESISVYSNKINNINFDTLVFLILYEISTNCSYNILEKLYNLNSTEIFHNKEYEKRKIESEVLAIIKSEFIQKLNSLSKTHKIIEMIYLI